MWRRVLTFSCLAALSSVFLIFSATPAFAGTGTTWLPLFSFNGSDSSAGGFVGVGGTRVAIDESSDTVYVAEAFKGFVDKFNLAGEAQNFSATGESSFQPYPGKGFGDFGDIAVDNHGPNKGRFYVSLKGEPVKAYEPSGELAWELDAGPDIRGLAVDTEGRLWLARDPSSGFVNFADAYASNGSPPAKVGSVETDFIHHIDLDANGNLYVEYQSLVRHDGVGLTLETDPAPTLIDGNVFEVTVDQSSSDGHIFVVQGANADSFAEYSSSGELLGEKFGEEQLKFSGGGIAHHPVSDRIYIFDGARVWVYGKATVTTPDLTIDPVSGIGASTADFSGTVSPLGVNSSYHFEWKKASQKWSEAASSPEEVLPADEATHPVSYEATGLAAKTTYNVRLVATNTDVGVKAFSGERVFSNVAVKVRTIAAAPRTDTTARINAMVEPSSNPATVHFELSEDGGETWTPLADHQVAEGQAGAIVVGHELSGLEPDTTYLYRAFAESELGEASPQGAEVELTTRTSAEMVLPERGIELVNNPDKGNQNVSSGSQMTADGEKALWSVPGGAPGGVSGIGNTFLAERSANGWRSKVVQPPAGLQPGGGEEVYLVRPAPDLSAFIGIVGGGASEEMILLRLDADQNQQLLGAIGKSVVNPSIDFTGDASGVVVLNPATKQLEEVGSGTPEIVSLMPDGTPSACGLNEQGISFPGILSRGGYHPIATTDASRVYFQAQPNGKCSALYGLHVRNREAETTTLIDPGAGSDPEFIRATPDGRAAYFATLSKLDPADTNKGSDVYRWDEEAGESSCLTCVVANANLHRSGSADILVSDDFSHVYFESKEQLVPGQGKAGDVNLYVLNDGEVRFVADTNVGGGALNGDTALSSDGNVLALTTLSNPSLTSDQLAPQCVATRGFLAPCEQLYLYDDREGGLECLSCLPGAVTTFSAGSPNEESVGDFKLSRDGFTVAFVTREGLAPLDVNRNSDVYEWRAGALRLVTDGLSEFQTGEAAPQVQAVDDDGTDILFSVAAPGLTGFEHDLLLNLYDARVGGGFEPPSPPIHCEGDSCQGPLQAPPPAQRTSSEGFSGRGNVSPQSRKRRPCAKKRGKAKRRCIRRHKRRAAQRAQRAHENGRAGR